MALDDIRAEKVNVGTEEPAAPRGRGRPPGSKKKPVLSTVPPQPEIPPEVVAGMLDNSLRGLVQVPCILMDMPPLPDQERDLVVEGTKPLINKYLPDMLGEWGAEIMFLAVIGMVYGPRFVAYRERQRASDSNYRKTGSGQNPSGEVHHVQGEPINRN